MKIEKLMTRDVRTCRPEDSLAEPARIMWENDCGCVPVVDAQMCVVGMITDRDICMGAYTQGRPLAEIPLPSVMSTTVHCCRSGNDIEDAVELLKAKQLHRVPVVNDSGQLVGLLSLNDIAGEAASGRTVPDKQITLEGVGRTLAAICARRLDAIERVVSPQPARKSAAGSAKVPLPA
jgi:CBS domain-containing protein